MAIKIGGTSVINDSRQLQNVASIDSATATAFNNAGVGGSNVGTKVTWSSSTSYSSVTFTGLSGATFIEVTFNGLGGTAGNGNEPIIQLGTSGGIKTSGYESQSGWMAFYAQSVGSGDQGFVWKALSQGASGFMRLVKDESNVWYASHSTNYGAGPSAGGGIVNLGGAITQLKYNRISGTFGNGEEMSSGAGVGNPWINVRWS